MQTLLGLFKSPQQGHAARARLDAEGFSVELIQRPDDAAKRARGETEEGAGGEEAASASGARLGAWAGGGVGALPGAVIGHLVGHWLTESNAHMYEREVDAGGILLVVQAPELEPAARAEDLLREFGADHVETGETPRF
jgi:hypothetical protein